VATAEMPITAPELHRTTLELLQTKIAEQRLAEVDYCMRGAKVRGEYIPGPLYWLHYVMGDDGSARGVRTFDEQYIEKGTEAFPRFPGPEELPYLPWMFNLFVREPRVFTPKSREMMASWSVMAFAVWFCQFFPRTRAVIQTQKEPKVVDLIKGKDSPGYARTLYERQPMWLQRMFPLSRPMKDQSQTEMTWQNESVIKGVPMGADQIRQYHPTLVIFDEAAHLSEFKASYGSADLVASKIIAVSSAGPSWFGDVCVEAEAPSATASA
jgi:hypothetical protein